MGSPVDIRHTGWPPGVRSWVEEEWRSALQEQTEDVQGNDRTPFQTQRVLPLKPEFSIVLLE